MKNKIIKCIICITSVIMLFNMTLTTYAWKTKNDRYPESTSSGGYLSTGSKFVDKGLPAPIIPDPVAERVTGRINIMLDGEYEYFFDKPLLIDGRVLLPFRELFEFFDMLVTWDEATSTVNAISEDKNIRLTINDNTVYVNDVAKSIDVPAQIIGDKTYVPVRFVAESLDFYVSWQDKQQTVTLISGGGNK